MGCGCQKAKLNEPTEYKPAASSLVIGKEIDLEIDRGSNQAPVQAQTQSLNLSPIDTGSSQNPSSYNILDVIKDKVTNNLIYVDAEIMRDRLGNCRACSSMTLGMCTECGCIVEFKVRYAKSSCPLNKW